MYLAYTPSAPQSHPYPHQPHPYLHTPTSDPNHHGKIMISSIPPDLILLELQDLVLVVISFHHRDQVHHTDRGNQSPVPLQSASVMTRTIHLCRFSPRRRNAMDIVRDGLPRTSWELLGVVFATLKDVNWTLGDFFYHLFRYQDQDGDPVYRSPRHASYINQFLNGTSGKGFGFILDTWMRPMEGGPRSDKTEQPTEFTMSNAYQAPFNGFTSRLTESHTPPSLTGSA